MGVRKICKLLIILMATLAFSSALFSRSEASTQSQIEILPTYSGYINDQGYYYVVGEVRNVGTTPVGPVNITATFYDVNGEFVALGNGTTTLYTILPGRKSPFEIFLYSANYSQRVHNYTLSVAQFLQAQNKPLGLEIITNSSHIDAEGFHVTGEIKNIGPEYTSFVKVVATFYNASGYVIATKFSYSNPKNLNPGQVATFEIILNSSIINKIDHYILEAESWDYALVPEFNPASLILILTASTATYLQSTKFRKMRGKS
jgi:hypothetical protein